MRMGVQLELVCVAIQLDLTVICSKIRRMMVVQIILAICFFFKITFWGKILLHLVEHTLAHRSERFTIPIHSSFLLNFSICFQYHKYESSVRKILGRVHNSLDVLIQIFLRNFLKSTLLLEF